MFKQQTSPRESIAPVAGQRKTSDLINGVHSFAVDLVMECDVAVAGAPLTAIRNRGSICAMFDEVGIIENGTDRIVMRGNVARAITEQAAPSPLSADRLTSTAVGNTHLEELVRVYFAHPLAVRPEETSFVEHDPRQTFQVFVKLASDGGAKSLADVPGGATLTITNLTVRVAHIYDGQLTVAPYFLPRIVQQVENVAGVNAALRSSLKGDNLIRALILSPEDSTDGEASDILNALVLRGDRLDVVGPQARPLEDMIAASELEFGGASGWQVGDAHLGMNFQRLGRLNQCLNPNQDTNLRLELDVQPGAGAGDSLIRVTRIELVYDPALCRPAPFAV